MAKAWTLRGTLHLHPADELGVWYAAQRAVAGASPESPEELEAWRDPTGVLHPPLGSDDVKSIRAAVWDVLDGRSMLREEIAEEVVKRVGPGPRQRLLSGFRFFLGELCQGPPQGSKVTFVRPDQWIDGWHEVRARYSARSAMISRRSTSKVAAAYVLAGDTTFPRLQPSLRLLPEDDVYIMGFRERAHLVPEAVREQLAARPRSRYEGPAGVRFVMIDGVAAGLWERKKRGKRVELRVAPTRRLTRS